jgi:prophage regulatory protein
MALAVFGHREGEISMTKERIIRLPEVEASVGIKKTAIYQKIDPKHKNYDPDFPKPIKIGKSAVGWLESAIQAYIRKKAGIEPANDGQQVAA